MRTAFFLLRLPALLIAMITCCQVKVAACCRYNKVARPSFEPAVIFFPAEETDNGRYDAVYTYSECKAFVSMKKIAGNGAVPGDRAWFKNIFMSRYNMLASHRGARHANAGISCVSDGP